MYQTAKGAKPLDDAAGRKDLAESKEILVLESFPSPEEITKAIYEVISEKGWGDKSRRSAWERQSLLM